jgi:hypothetical protein
MLISRFGNHPQCITEIVNYQEVLLILIQIKYILKYSTTH